MQKILIASDHAGYELKEAMKVASHELGVEFEDLGTQSLESVDYPDFANALSLKLLTLPQGSLGVLICGSGVGVSIAANRHAHIRAVLAESVETAKLGRQHNHSNVLCLGARSTPPAKAFEIFKAFYNAIPDEGDRHVRRVEKLK